MDFLPHDMPGSAPVDLSSHDSTSSDHHSLFQPGDGLYGVDGAFAFTQQAQPLGGQSTTTENHTPRPSFEFTTLSSHEQHYAKYVGIGQSASSVPTGPAPPMGPPAHPRKRKAPTLRPDDWEPYKDRILELHITQNLKLPEVKQMIEDEYGFKAEVRQYRLRISQWGNDKNVKPREMKAIVRKRQKRKLIETEKDELIFEVRGSQVDPQKIERWMKRHEVAQSFLYAPSPTASTPSAVRCHTVSERGSPAMMSMSSPAASVSWPRVVPVATQSPQMPSPALSVSSIIRLQDSTFTGQSPTMAYRSLPHLHSGSVNTPYTLESEMEVDARPRYRQDEEERLREQIFRAETSVGTRALESSESSDVPDMLYALVGVLLAQGRYKTAEEVTRRLVESRKSQSRGDGGNSDDDVKTLQAIDLLGQVLLLQGLYTNAERLQGRALKGREELLGPEHPDTLRSLGNLATVLGDIGKYKEAEAMNRRTLALRNKVLGPKHPEMLPSMSNLAFVMNSQGKHEEAEMINRQTLALSEEILGSEHPETLRSMSNLARVLLDQGKHEEAETMCRQVLEQSEKVLGLGHPYTLNFKSNLAVVLNDQGKHEEAETIHRQVLAQRERVLGLEHPDTLKIKSNLAVVLNDQGKHEEAETIHRQVLAQRERVLGLEHPDTLKIKSNLAVVLNDQGKHEEAETIHRQVLAQRERVLGLEHPDTLKIKSNLAVVLNDQGKHEEAETIHRQVLAQRERVLGLEHPGTLKIKSNLAVVLNDQGKHEEAETMNRQTLEQSERVLGLNHPDTILSVYNLAQVLAIQYRLDESRFFYERACAALSTVLGDDHPITRDCHEDYLELLASQK